MSLKLPQLRPDAISVTSQNEPFGPPPTRPPTFEEVALDGPVSPSSTRRRPLAGGRRQAMFWAAAIATVAFSGATGRLLDSRWSYATLGASFAALLLVVLAVTRPTDDLTR
ncbi:MAG: hypothetical protein R2733_04200 [Acidimicrobiales bacterium]